LGVPGRIFWYWENWGGVFRNGTGSSVVGEDAGI